MDSPPSPSAPSGDLNPRQDPTPSRTDPLGRGASWATGLALFFLALSLLALTLVPAYRERDVRRIHEQVQEVLVPAEGLAADVEGAQVAQMAALEAFLATGEGTARQRYRTEQSRENLAFEALQSLVGDFAPEAQGEVQQALTRILNLSFSWHLRHQPVLNEDVTREAYLEELEVERQIHQELLSASRALRSTLTRETRRGLERLDRARTAQTRLSRVLALLGLVATLVVVFLGAHVRGLMRELETRRQEALRARREVDALLEATGDGVLGIDRNGKCTFLNRAGAELLGYPTRMVVGRDIHDLLHHSYPDGTPVPREECPILAALSEGKALSGKAETLWRAGRTSFPVQISQRPMRDGLTLKGAVLTFTDMTSVRAAEASLRQAIRARDEVLAVVSHDLRNPVGTIFSTASLLLDLELPRDRERDPLLAVQRSAQPLNRLIQDLLDVARMEAGALGVAPEPFPVAELLEDLLEAHRGRAGERRIDVLLEGDGETLTGWGDRDRVLQVLSNLLENALKFTPAGGRVEVGVRQEEDDRELLFWVSDTGPGVSPADRERLFDRFWQVSRKDKRGAGLGLSIVKGLVEAHGGRIWVESPEGGGATFRFTLPGEPGSPPGGPLGKDA